MPDLINYYQVLRVPPDADLAGIQNAYSRLSREFAQRVEHDEARRQEFEQLNEAYEVLADPRLRIEYDRVFFADQYAAFHARVRRAIMRRQISHWTLLGLIGIAVAIEAILLAAFSSSYVGAAGDALGDAWGQLSSATGWVVSGIERAHSALGNPIGWFKDLGAEIKRATR